MTTLDTLKSLISDGAFVPSKPSIRHDTYSSSIASVARGIVRLSEVRPSSLVDITDFTPASIPESYTLMRRKYGPRHKFIMTNPDPDRYIPEANIWGSLGELGLQAIILETGYTADGRKTVMTLALPTWMKEAEGRTGTVCTLKISLDGYALSNRYTLFVKAKGKYDSTRVTNPASCLQYVLGMFQPDGTPEVRSATTGTIDGDIGFPGAESYIVTKLPELGNYLGALAQSFSKSPRR